MKTNILFAPIHYILDAKNSGSEFSWAYQIYQRISERKDINSSFIAGGVRNIHKKSVIDCHIFNPQQLDLSIINIVKFYFATFVQGRRYKKKHKVAILHHVLPFAINNSFNLLALVTKVPFIIGPVQSGLIVQDTDVSRADALGFKKGSNVSIQEIVERIGLFILRPIISFLSNQTLHAANKIIVVNEYTKQLLLKKNIAEEKLVIIPPGIDSRKFKYVPYTAKQSKKIKLIAVGHLRKRKGMDLIIKAMQKVVKQHKNVQLLIVGDGPQRKSLEKLVTELRLNNWIRFVGFVPNEQIGKYYQQSHIFVSMSRAEAFATISLEAMASGLAVISSRVGGFFDTIIDEVNGYLVDKEDDTALAEKIIHLVNNPGIIAKFGKISRETVEEKYDWSKRIIPKYLRIYKELIKDKQR